MHLFKHHERNLYAPSAPVSIYDQSFDLKRSMERLSPWKAQGQAALLNTASFSGIRRNTNSCRSCTALTATKVLSSLVFRRTTLAHRNHTTTPPFRNWQRQLRRGLPHDGKDHVKERHSSPVCLAYLSQAERRSRRTRQMEFPKVPDRRQWAFGGGTWFGCKSAERGDLGFVVNGSLKSLQHFFRYSSMKLISPFGASR